MVRAIQGLFIYDVVARDFYGVDIPAADTSSIHLRRVRDLARGVLAIDDRPLTCFRPPARRLPGRCHHYMLLLTAALRRTETPARARCGFADYFNPGYYEDHWVCEYWDTDRDRWVLVDAQLDEVWRNKLGIDFDILDVPRERFLVAGEAWSRCRSADADPSRFGIHHTGVRGLWFVAGDLVRDIAALNKDEPLPWDVWGAQPRPNQHLDTAQIEYFDRLADLSRNPDAHFVGLRDTYRHDEWLRVPDTVVNALLGHPEPAR